MFEYYFSVRTDTGLYNETVCYLLQYNGKWETYQECIDEDCYIGAQIKSAEDLGNIFYRATFQVISKFCQLNKIIPIKIISLFHAHLTSVLKKNNHAAGFGYQKCRFKNS